MNPLHQNSAGRHFIRIKGYNYSRPGYYFITNCTRHSEYFFGEIIHKQMILSTGGKAVQQCWDEIPTHYPQVFTHCFQIMPNHVHGILEISSDEKNVKPAIKNVENPKFENQGKILDGDSAWAQNVEPLHSHMMTSGNGFHIENKFQHIIPESLGCIVRGFKAGVTKWFRQNTQIQDVWQRNYYERILITEKEYWRATRYIQTNPKYWVHDRFFKKQISKP